MPNVKLAEQWRAQEQRSAARKAIRLAAEIVLPNGETLMGQTADISHAGIGFFSPVPTEVGGDCTLIVRISACGVAADLKLVGRVCYCTKQEEGCYRVGMQFIRMDEQTAAILGSALR